MGELDTSKGAVRAQRSIARNLFPELRETLRGIRGYSSESQIAALEKAISQVDPETGKAALIKEFAARIARLHTDGQTAKDALATAIEIVKARQEPSPEVNHPEPVSDNAEIEAELQAIVDGQAPQDLSEFGEENKAAQIGRYLQGFGWKAEVAQMGKRGGKFKVIGTRPGVRVELEYDGATCAGGYKTDVNGKTLRIHSASALKKFVELGK